jgi:hypothetical protein
MGEKKKDDDLQPAEQPKVEMSQPPSPGHLRLSSRFFFLALLAVSLAQVALFPFCFSCFPSVSGGCRVSHGGPWCPCSSARNFQDVIFARSRSCLRSVRKAISSSSSAGYINTAICEEVTGTTHTPRSTTTALPFHPDLHPRSPAY